jgi:pimeloyl-ACP methyl ester carboxylesterase
MRRLFVVVAVLMVALIALPPFYFRFFPVEPPRLPAQGLRVAVREGQAVNAIVKGEGPPVVLVHGLPGCAYDWAPLTDALAARGFRVIAYDRIGYGYSDPRSDGDFSIAANARDLLGLLASQELSDVTVVGWSYGGPVAIEAAGRDAGRIGRLVLVGTAAPQEASEQRPPALFGLIFSAPVLAWVRAVPPVGRALQAAMSRDAFSDAAAPAWWLPQLAANFAAPHTTRSFREEGARVGAGDESIDPVTVGRPILLIHGDDDRLAPLSNAEWTEGHARDAELVVVPKGSHMLPITHPDLLADRIAAFARAGQAAQPEEG